MDEFGDRMKFYEAMESERRFLPMLPICARLDGRGFSKFTKGLKRPYDERMSDLMCLTTAFLVENTQATIGYTQSDEISLIFYNEDYKNKIFFDGRTQKLVSVLASMATAFFNDNIPEKIPEKKGKLAFFDCRVWQVPSLDEACNTLLWREIDATKNSISMAAQHYYSHKELQNKSGSEMQEMLFQKGVNWNNYPSFFKRGTYIQKRTFQKIFSHSEISSLPEKHLARTNPNLIFDRSEIQRLNLPPLKKIKNRKDMIFFGQEPILETEK